MFLSYSRIEEDDYPLHHVGSADHAPPLRVDVEIDDKAITMELDTGAAYSLVNEKMFQELWPGTLSPSQVRLTAYSGDNIPVCGMREVLVKYKGQDQRLPLLIVKGEGPSLFVPYAM